MRTTTYASFVMVDMAEKALGALLDHGVQAEDISVIFHENYRGVDNEETPEETPDIREVAKSGITTTTMPDAAVGAAKGAGIGAGIGAIAAVTSVLIPGVGLVIGGGALAAAIAGMVGTTAAGAVAGGLTGYLKDQGVPEASIEEFNTTLNRGGAVVGVTVPSNNITEQEVNTILHKYGAYRLESSLHASQ